MSQSGIKFRSSSVKSLKSSTTEQPSKLQIISKHPFEINPAHIVFKDIEHSKEYQVKVEIRNLTKKPQRIRFQKFNNPRFLLEAMPQAEIAVGLSISVIVKYQCLEEIPEAEILKVHSSDGFTQQLSLNTYPKKSKIVFEPFVNLGFVEQNTQSMRQMVIQNQGEKAGQLKFTSNEPTMLTIEPQTINLGVKSSSTLTIKYKPSEAGYFKGIIEIKSSQMLAKNFIEVVATSLQKARFIVNPNKLTSQQPDMVFDFRTVYSGQQKILKAFLINNSPKPMKFKTLTKKGLLEHSQEVTMNYTPAEEALEEREKVFAIRPEQGIVQPFTEFELELKCKSQISYKQKAYVTSYAMADYFEEGSVASMRNAKDFTHQRFYEYTAIVKSEEQKPMLLHLKAIVTCPEIKVSKKSLLFGDCILQEMRKEELVIENRNKSERVGVVLPKIPYLDFIPAKFVLEGGRSKVVEVILRPKVIGKIDETQLIVINDLYEVPLRCMGIVRNDRSMSQKQLSRLPVDDGKVTQSPGKKFSSRRLSVFQTQKPNKCIQNDSELNYLTHRKLGSLGNLEFDPRTKSVSVFIENKEKFSKLLTSRREEREKKQAQKDMRDKYSQMKEKLEKRLKNQTYDQEGLPESSPVDIEFELGSIKDISEKEPKLSRVPETLYVTKHIGSYVPQAPKGAGRTSLARTSEDKPKKIFPQTPQIFNQRRQIQRQLSIEQLQLIEVSETKIYFGEVYVKSECIRYFWLRNGTRFAVSCRVAFSSPEMAKSYSKAQTIPSYQEAGFPLTLCRHTLGDYFTEGEYIINDRYRYKLSVVAKVGEVVIAVNKETLKFQFAQNNLEMSMGESVTFTNPGNSEAKFRWTLGKEKYFAPHAIEGVVQARQTVTVPIQLNLSSIVKSLKKPGDLRAQQKLSLKILDGQQKQLTCTFHMLEPKYTVKCQLFTKKSTIFLNNQLSEILEIKNTTKQAIVIHLTPFEIDLSSSDKVRLMPDETKKIKVKFLGSKVGEVQCRIGLCARGGVRKDFEFGINVIQPELSFSDEELHMEPLIVRSTRGEAFFTLCHKQELPIPLVFDLRPKKYNKSAPQHIEHMQLSLLTPGEVMEAVSPTLKSEQDQNIINQNLVDQKIDIDEIEDRLSNQSFDDEEENLEKDEQELRRYRFIAKPGNEYQFRVEFIAPQIGVYKLQVPVQIQKSVKVRNAPLLKCEAIQPRFLFEPSNIDFKKKYIGRPQRSFPKIVEILICNDNFEPIEWSLDCSALQELKTFSFEPKAGYLNPQQSTRIKALFNPFTVGQFQTSLPLFIKSQKQQSRIKFCSVSLKGCSSQPQLFFNKREVIMPVVPLGVESTTFFRILNDGYDNLNLSYEFEDDLMGLDVKLGFPEGNNVGISRQKVRVDLSWKFDKPISFTLMLTFKDDSGREFRIPVSGTTDNSILTNYMYLLRNEGKFKVKQEGALQLFELSPNATVTTSLQRKHSSHSLKSNSTNRSIMSYLGIAPINPYVLSTTLEYIKKYLNENLLTIPINEFPQSMVQSDGKPMIEVLLVTAGKSAKYPWVYQGNAKGEDKVRKLLTQYTELIKLLKTEGAMLNHIRPEYLLSFQDLNLYLSTLPAEKSRCYMPSLLKINSGLFNYLSVESWTTLLYQILKLNVVSRVSAKNIKSYVPFYKQRQIPSQYLEKSNFISVSESILLHWCEEAYREVLFKEVRLTSFDRDFRTGIVLSAVIERYARNSLTARLVPEPKNEEQEKKNAKIICQALEEIGLLGHIEPKYIFSPFQREMVILVMYLYMYLPAYIPKDQPIFFDCVLGEEIIKSIELKNPSTKPLKYKAKYVGSENFVLLNDEVFTIEPKSSYDFQIKYVSRFVREIKGRVTFVNLKDKTTGQGSTLSGSTIVFELKSRTVQVISEKTWKVSSILYEPSEYTVQIQNNIQAPENTQFTLKVKTEYLMDNKKKTKHIENTGLSPQEQVQVIVFKTETIKVKKGSIEPLTFTYLPMSLHRTKTLILFSNEFVGEFQHQIEATAEQPTLTAEFRPNLTMYAGDVYEWEYMLTVRNEFLQKAKKTYETLTARKAKGNATGSPGKSKIKVTNQVEDPKDVVLGCKKYEVDIEPNQNVSLVQKFIVLSEEAKKDKKPKPQQTQAQQPQSTPQNSIKFKFTCKQPIFEFPLKIRLKDSKSLDVRLYRLILIILPKPLLAVLEMTTPQRKELVQELPFINHTQKDWNMKVNWVPGNGFTLGGNCGSGFVVKRESVFKLPVLFRPKIKEDSQAKLIVVNPTTLDQFEYQIKGRVQDPLSQDHIDIQCGINEPVNGSLQLTNPYTEKPISLRVQTDIANFQGESRVTIPPNGNLSYTFKLTAMVCGEFNSCITFWEVEGSQYFWFTVVVRTNVGSAAMTIDVESEIRQRKVQQINIPVRFNLKSPEEFEVSVKGEGVLGPQKMILYPVGSKEGINTLSIEYLPLKLGSSFGSLYLVNPSVGEVLIDLNLRCHPRPAKIYHLIKSPLGVGSKQSITLQNPINAKISITYKNSNPETFVVSIPDQHQKKISQPSIKLQPFEKKVIKVEYIPGSIDSVQKAEIVFHSDEVGQWEYHFSGIGVAPTEFEPLVVYRELSWLETSSIKFRNPFNYAISVGIKMIVEQQWQAVFKLNPIGKDIVTVEPHGNIEVPFVFAPDAIAQYFCAIRILLSDKIFWTFPIMGIAECVVKQFSVSLKAKCRQTVRVEKSFQLDGVEKFNNNNQYNMKFFNVPHDAQNYLELFVQAQLIKKSLQSEKDNLVAEFLFRPMKPFRTTLDLSIERINGGRWIYKLNVEAVPPEFDDRIEMQSAIMSTCSVSFRITNKDKKTVPFKAYLTQDSAHQFSVEPSSEELAKYGSKGTEIRISFTPVEYGKDKTGKLVIETEEMYWWYEVVGRLPKYLPPGKKVEGTSKR